MNIPNMLSLLRIALTPLFVLFYMQGEQGTSMLLLAVAALSDMLDGAIARRFDMITPLGKVLDPVADKLLQLAMLLCLLERSPRLSWLLALHVLRELSLLGLGALAYRQSGVLIGAHWYGKLCTALMYLLLGAALVWQTMPERLLELSAELCGGLMVYCLFRYAAEYLQLIRGADGKRVGN